MGRSSEASYQNAELRIKTNEPQIDTDLHADGEESGSVSSDFVLWDLAELVCP